MPEQLLEAAAAPTFERIRRDRKRVHVQVKPLLAHLEEHLFDPDLDAKRLKQACGVRDNSVALIFHHALGLPPYGYIEDCRFSVAFRLLTDTELKVWRIAQLLGYSTLQVFSRAFERWSGLRPTVYRRRNSTSEATEVVSTATLRRAVLGELEREEADRLARQLTALYPESFTQIKFTVSGGATSYASTFDA